MIKIEPFEAVDIPRLIGWIPDARFLLQWAGPQYSYPLDIAQVMATLKLTRDENPTHFMFKATHSKPAIVIGHAELMAINYEPQTAVLGRVLIGPPDEQGKGYGKQMIQAVLAFGFDTLKLDRITLGVFDFNTSAIKCYKELGFQQYDTQQRELISENETWTLIRMELAKASWRRQQSDINVSY